MIRRSFIGAIIATVAAPWKAIGGITDEAPPLFMGKPMDWVPKLDVDEQILVLLKRRQDEYNERAASFLEQECWAVRHPGSVPDGIGYYVSGK